MRIIAGKYRGRKLVTPGDDMIRPTSDRMRETIFNILGHSSAELEGARVLDVFAGTGAMGLEALSRGAGHVTFFDNSPQALRLVSQNIARLAVGKATLTHCVAAPRFPPSSRHYDMVFLDPPYNLDLINTSLSALAEKNYLTGGSMIIVEYSLRNDLIFPDSFPMVKEKTCGKSRFCLLRYTP
ncbi:MAG: 16S rRNA (guanine(966)-N(2))-methyltransferase RsmD [Alphaproteobacteria bacterium]|nr:16S rRNA (guanine(966)-N(2))-methyltransferase RsmD [Alphaproteobacteria bacterium]